MSEDDEFEADRIKKLEENRKAWAKSNVDLDQRFGPGSFGCHEAMHVAEILAGVVERELCNHSAVLRDPYWNKFARRACDNLAQLHFAMDAVHLDAENPEGRSDQSAATGKALKKS